MGSTWDPPGSCWTQMDPMLAPGSLLSGKASLHKPYTCSDTIETLDANPTTVKFYWPNAMTRFLWMLSSSGTFRNGGSFSLLLIGVQSFSYMVEQKLNWPYTGMLNQQIWPLTLLNNAIHCYPNLVILQFCMFETKILAIYPHGRHMQTNNNVNQIWHEGRLAMHIYEVHIREWLRIKRDHLNILSYRRIIL